MTKLSPFYTDEKTAKAIIAAAKNHQAQAQNGQIIGAGTSDATTQFQNTCQFKLTADWKERSPSNFVASGNKIVPLNVGAEKRPYPTTLYAYGTKPTSSKDSIIVATRRANRWVLLPTGNGEAAPTNQKVRLVQPKELFPACEYKTIQNVYDCELQYSDDNDEWTTVVWFDIDRWRQYYCGQFLNQSTSHKYWRINLKGFSKPPVPNDPFADRGFYTYGQLWEMICFGGRGTETDTAVAWDVPAVLVFSDTTGTWNYQKYPPMPNPRWSAASVLIKGLVRKGETEPCDRIFVIGGRNIEGFVAAVDVFNLRYNEWETDWKGLDQGELENYTASGTGGRTTIIVNGGGSDCKAISAATVRQVLEEAGFEVG